MRVRKIRKRITLMVCSALVLMLCGCGVRKPTPPVMSIPTTLIANHKQPVTSLRGVEGLVCFNCHNALTVDTGDGIAIAFSHESHLNRGFHCNQCHISLAHGGRIMPGHPECFICHDGMRASQDCELCHLRRADIDPHPPNFILIHGEVALRPDANCALCHTRAFCLNCHTLEMPHPPNWVRTHGARIDEGDCSRCHTREFCNDCHRRTLPQSHLRRDWMQVHGEFSMQLGSNCALCHNRQFCLNCHGLPMPHPSGWTSGHAGPGRNQTEVCWRCHQVEECRNCHTERRILGHPAEFRVGHAQAARGPDPDCRVCHSPAFCARCHTGDILPE